jgi:hypothetical protein
VARLANTVMIVERMRNFFIARFYGVDLVDIGGYIRT